MFCIPERSPYARATFWADLQAGIMLSVSYVPIAMALGAISGMGPLAGLWCGVIVGTISALLGGTRALVSGPSAVLAVITATLLAGHQTTLPQLATIIIMAGFIQVALGLTGVGRFIFYMPHIVLVGFTSGIGILLLSTQAQKLLQLGMSDIAIAGCGLIILFIWPARTGRYIPPAVAVLAFSLIIAKLLPDVERLGPIPAGLPDPVLEIPSLAFLSSALGPAALIALISSIYTLMWSLIADSFTGSQHNPNRELFGVGLGNIVAGFLGALPGSANIATMTARRFGGKTVVAGIVCQIVIFTLLLGLSSYVAAVPLAMVSAIVMSIGWKLIDFSFLRKTLRMDVRHSSIMLLIMCLTIFVDPLSAIVFGVIAANIIKAAQLEELELDSVISTPLLDATFEAGTTDDFDARIGLLAFRGVFTVSSSRKLVHQLCKDIRDHEILILDLSDATYVDDSAANLLASLIDHANQSDTQVVVCGLTNRIRGTLYAFDVLDRIPENRVLGTQKEARNLAWSLLSHTVRPSRNNSA